MGWPPVFPDRYAAVRGHDRQRRETSCGWCALGIGHLITARLSLERNPFRSWLERCDVAIDVVTCAGGRLGPGDDEGSIRGEAEVPEPVVVDWRFDLPC